MNIREAVLWFVLVALVVVIGWVWSNPLRQVGGERVNFSEFMSRVAAGKVASIAIAGQDAIVTTTDKATFVTRLPRESDVLNTLLKKGIAISIVDSSHSAAVELLLLYSSTVLPWFTLLLVVLSWLRIRTLEKRLAPPPPGTDER